jgi:hypothetical protein
MMFGAGDERPRAPRNSSVRNTVTLDSQQIELLGRAAL